MIESEARKIVDKLGARCFLKLLVEKHGVSLDTISELMLVEKRTLLYYLNGRRRVPEYRVDCLLAGICEIKA